MLLRYDQGCSRQYELISLACVSSETRNLQGVFFSFVFMTQKGRMVPRVPSRDRGTWEYEWCSPTNGCSNQYELISLACVSSETHNLQGVFFSFVFMTQKGIMVPRVPSRDRGTWK